MTPNDSEPQSEQHDAYNAPSAASDAIPIERLRRRGEFGQIAEIRTRSVPYQPLVTMLLAVIGVLFLVGVLNAIWPAGFGVPMLGAFLICYWAVQDGRFPMSGGFFAFIGCIFSTLLTLAALLSFGLAGLGLGISLAFLCLAGSTYLSFRMAHRLFYVEGPAPAEEPNGERDV